MSFFRPQSAAARYAGGRPYFHPLVIRRIKEFLSLEEPFRRALDVGCGTGLSTVALKDIARDIVGVDASPEMVALAPKDSRIVYLVSVAENLPFGKSAFDLVTVSQVFHWLDRDRFFMEARRVLRAGGCLVVYDNYFSGQMEENAEFRTWYQESFLKKYPRPPRQWPSFTVEDTKRDGFNLVHHEWHRNTRTFSLETLVDYLVTLSNIIAAGEGGKEEIREVRRGLAEHIKPFFRDMRQAKFLFNAPVWFIQLPVSGI